MASELKAMPWSEQEEEEEEKRVVLSLVPLQEGESDDQELRLAARFSLCPAAAVTADSSSSSVEEMLVDLIHDQYPNLASSEAFRDSVRRALNQSFEVSLMYLSCSYFWTDKENVQTSMMMTNVRHLTWLIERMVELRFEEADLKQWIEQDSTTNALMEVVRGYERREVALGLTAHVIRCTCKFANAVASGSINLADAQVRMKVLKDWVQVLIVGNEKVLPIFGMDESTYRDLETMFLRIISTIPMRDSLELLKQCIRSSTLNVEESPHLLCAFNTWFRRAAQRSD